MRTIVLLAAAMLALVTAAPLASANTADCEFGDGADGNDFTPDVAERAVCTVVGIVLHNSLEAVQCVLSGDGDLC